MEPHASIWEHCLETAALSDIGLRRGNNQDSMVTQLAGSQEAFEQRGHLFMVADGMGAHAAGELASKMAADEVALAYQKFVDRSPPEALLAAIEDANSQIHNRGMASDDFRGMGTTISTLVLLPQGAVVAHVGDSRVYRLRSARLDQLTFDHSLVWELRTAGNIPLEELPNYIPKNIITRSLGPNPEVQVDREGPFPLQPGDTFLLCSDGLSGQIKDDEIGKLLLALPPKEAVRALVDLANLRGGPDNITVIVVRVTRPLAAQAAKPRNSATDSRATNQGIHPAIWVIMAGMVLLAGLLAAFEAMVWAVLALCAAIGTGVVALLQRLASPTQRRDDEPFGKGPYVSCDCTPDASMVERLAQTVRQLKDAAATAAWTIDWEKFGVHEARAASSAAAEEYLEAIREYARAMVFMMAELRSQSERAGQKGDDCS